MSVDVDFPPDLPCVSRIDGYGIGANASLLRTPIESGNASQRRSNARMPQEIKLAWRVDNNNLKPLLAWLNSFGYEWFNLRLASIESSALDEFASDIAVRLMSDINTTLNPIYNQQWWTVTVSAEYQPPVSALYLGIGTAFIGSPDVLLEDEESTMLVIPLTRFQTDPTYG